MNIMEPFSHLCNDWIGIAVCVVLCSLLHHQIQSHHPIKCTVIVNGINFNFVSSKIVALPDHIFLYYLLPQLYLREEDKKSLWECDANGFYKIGIKIDNTPSSLVKKCGLRVVYKKDIEDFNSTMAQCSNNSIIPYVPHHNFKFLAVVVEVNKNDCEKSSQYKEFGEKLSN